MFALAPAGVGVHFERMVGHGATGTLDGLEARIATQIEYLPASFRLLAHGLDVVRFDWLRQVRSIFEEPPHRVHALARSVDTPEAEAIFLSGIGMPTLSMIQEIEDDLCKPMISSASAMMWNCLRLAGVSPSSVPGCGRLFKEK